MKFLPKSLFVVAAAITACALAPQARAKTTIDIAIFKAKLTTADFTLNAPSGDFVVYSSVVAQVDKRGKLKGSAVRYDSISGTSIPVTIKGKIKGKAKLKGAGAERYAYVKGTISFSDGATGTAEFASRKFPKPNDGRTAKLGLDYLTGLFSLIQLLLGDQVFTGQFFFFSPK